MVVVEFVVVVGVGVEVEVEVVVEVEVDVEFEVVVEVEVGVEVGVVSPSTCLTPNEVLALGTGIVFAVIIIGSLCFERGEARAIKAGRSADFEEMQRMRSGK